MEPTAKRPRIDEYPEHIQKLYNKQKFVRYHEEEERGKSYHRMEQQKAEKKLNNEVDMNEYFTEKFLEEWCFGFCADTLKKDPIAGRRRNISEPVYVTNQIQNDPSYNPNGQWRLLLKENLTMTSATGQVTPIFCDLDMMSSDHCLHDMVYTDTNLVEVDNEEEKREITIFCNCEGGCSTSSCTCLEFQKKLAGGKNELENLGNGVILDKHKYKSKIYGTNSCTSVMICCGELCGCPKECSNRIENILLEHQFEIFRRNIVLGFGLRTLNNIHMHQLICEFTGRIRPIADCGDIRRADYCFAICDQDGYDFMWKTLPLLEKDKKIVKIWKKHIEEKRDEAHENEETDSNDEANPDDNNETGEVQGTTKNNYDYDKKRTGDDIDAHLRRPVWEIDPYGAGNVGRFATHGCFPNAIFIRVICNYMHPVFHRIFLKASLPIPAGTEITLNYGSDYVANRKEKLAKEGRKWICQCDTFLCEENHQMQAYWKQLLKSQRVKLLSHRIKFLQKHCKEKAKKYANTFPNGKPKFDMKEIIDLDNDKEEEKIECTREILPELDNVREQNIDNHTKFFDGNRHEHDHETEQLFLFISRKINNEIQQAVLSEKRETHHSIVKHLIDRKKQYLKWIVENCEQIQQQFEEQKQTKEERKHKILTEEDRDDNYMNGFDWNKIQFQHFLLDNMDMFKNILRKAAKENDKKEEERIKWEKQLLANREKDKHQHNM